ncbi:MAG: hypothetical protein PF487_01135 [Bacteroidales bacterium]|jgi:hypothetical protein|nr:hypothetical protein [Bacteroidales bacterium]
MVQISKIYKKRQFTYANAIISALSEFENQYDKKLIFEANTDMWNVNFKFSENRGTENWQLERKRVNLKDCDNIIQVITRKGIVFLYNVRI